MLDVYCEGVNNQEIQQRDVVKLCTFAMTCSICNVSGVGALDFGSETGRSQAVKFNGDLSSDDRS